MLCADEIFLIAFFSCLALMIFIASIAICMHHINWSVLNIHVHPEHNIPIQIVIMGQDAVIVEQPSENSVQIIGIRES